MCWGSLAWQQHSRVSLKNSSESNTGDLVHRGVYCHSPTQPQLNSTRIGVTTLLICYPPHLTQTFKELQDNIGIWFSVCNLILTKLERRHQKKNGRRPQKKWGKKWRRPQTKKQNKNEEDLKQKNEEDLKKIKNADDLKKKRKKWKMTSKKNEKMKNNLNFFLQNLEWRPQNRW